MNNRKKQIYLISGMTGQRGAVAIMVALLLGVLIGITALAVDIGYLMAARNKMQNIVDAAALAGASALRKKYKDSVGWSYSAEQRSELMSVVQDVVDKNRAEGETITIADDDVTISNWDPKENQLIDPVSIPNHPNAVKVTASNSTVPTFFAWIFGTAGPSIIKTEATAALVRSGIPSEASAGEIFLPVGISKDFFDSPNYYDGKGVEIQNGNYDDGDRDLSWRFEWHTYDSASGPSDPDNLLNILGRAWTSVHDGTPGESPAISAGETIFNFLSDDDFFNPVRNTEIGNKMEALFEEAVTKNNSSTWTTKIVVYGDSLDGDTDGRKRRTIVGFSTLTITALDPQLHGSERGLIATISRDRLPVLVQ